MGTAGVAAGHSATVEAGMSVLDDGGTAADAAVAAVLASCVAETIMTGLGGGGFATYLDAGTGQVSCLDFFVAIPGIDGPVTTAPLEPIEVAFGDVPLEFAIGAASVAVPGVPAGCQELHHRFGKLAWSQVVAPAIRLAEAGVPLPPRHAAALRDIAPALLPGDGGTAYAPQGKILTAGQRVYHRGLADTLRMLSAEGCGPWYHGEPADEIVRAVRAAGGGLGPADLAAYRVRDVPVRSARFAGRWVSGRDDLAHTVAVLAGLDVALESGVEERTAVIAQALAAAPDTDLGDTTHVSVLDADGNACAVTTTMGIGSGVWLPQRGVHLNSMLGEGELRSSGSVAGQRMSSMMCPVVVRDMVDGRVRLVAGSAGASRIRSALIHTLVYALADRREVAEAVAGPRFHPIGSTVHCEAELPDSATRALERSGYRIHTWDRGLHYFGGVAAVTATGAAGDPRRDGAGRIVRDGS